MKEIVEPLVRPLDFGRTAPFWSWAAPAAAWVGWTLLGGRSDETLVALLLAALLFPSILAAVHHAEVIAVKVGEPFGTLVLALAVTVIECALIITLMLAKPQESATLVRDTVQSAIMIILAGVVGLCIAVGAARHHVQHFGLHGVAAANTALTALAVIVLVLPNYTTSSRGSTFSDGQLVMVAVASLVIWLMFIFIQTVRHRDYFLPTEPEPKAHIDRDSATLAQALFALGLLLACLGAVVLLAKALSEPLAAAIVASGAPISAVGVIIAAVVLAPESLAAVRAARANRLQTSLNLALGSALATIGLTVPIIAGLALWFDWTLVLGLDPKGMTLLALMLLIASMSLGTGRTTVLQGAVHLVIFGVFLFTAFFP